MKDLGTLTIETDRLILRKITIEDAIDMYNNWCKEDLVSKYVPWSTHKDVEETKTIISKWIEEYKNEHTYNWIVVLKENNEPIGTISVTKRYIEHKTCEIGYVYGSKYWSKGYGTEALKAVINYLINDVGFSCIQSCHIDVNPASGKVMEKSGMILDGVLHSCKIDKSSGKRCDLVNYYILNNKE